ncbi:hypothetical protein CC2G_013542 [Coprinopsis cinerea AmutBmut pab1-1]|nr:hypothetical protein CC2G_013542 [Coprinopsis cinerea AmutBmut pab1-1]
MTNASTKTKADMPAPTSKEAPKWKGKARKLGEFWARFEEYATSCNVPVADKAEIALRYVVKDKDKEIWEAVPGYPAEYERWKNGVNGLYSEDEKKARRSLAELAKFIEKSRKKKIRKESDLTSYYREFLRLAHPLKTAGTLPEAMMNEEFWFGLHKKAREEINARLTVTKENWDRKNAPTIEEVMAAGRYVYNSDAFDKVTSSRWKSRYRPSSSDSDLDSSSSDSDSKTSSDSDSDSEDERRRGGGRGGRRRTGRTRC